MKRRRAKVSKELLPLCKLSRGVNETKYNFGSENAIPRKRKRPCKKDSQVSVSHQKACSTSQVQIPVGIDYIRLLERLL